MKATIAKHVGPTIDAADGAQGTPPRATPPKATSVAYLSTAEWDKLLAHALNGRSLDVVYQPVVDLTRANIVGYEALARFAGPTWLRPDDFFRAARARGIVARLDAVALEAACAAEPELPPGCFLAVNIEPDSLGHPGVDAGLRRLRTGREIVVELTEHVPLEAPGLVEHHLAEHRAHGVRVAIDDAGSGYAGLRRILHLRPALLKLDGSIVAGLADDPAKAALVSTLVVFAERIGATLLAEGVERAVDAAALQHIGVALAQGFFFAKPGAPWPRLRPSTRRFLRRAVVHGTPRPTASPPSLAALLAPAPSISHGEIVERVAPKAGALAPTVVLDDDGRAIELIDAAGVRTTMSYCVRVDATLAEAVHSMLSRPAAQRLSPVACEDARGRFLGLLYPERVLEALGNWASTLSPLPVDAAG